MRLLISEEPLTRQYLDHPLSGNWKGYRDLHIELDWLLIYHLEAKTIRFERTDNACVISTRVTDQGLSANHNR